MILPGTEIDRYQVVKCLGQGAMGDVHLALDRRSGRYVALKVLSEAKAGVEDFLGLFRWEARLSSLLSHRNVVSFIGAGEVRGLHYIAMEYVTGINLADLLEKKGGRLEEDLALSIVQDVTYGLMAAHQKHVVHRDVKPENVLVTNEGVIKLIDFGVATFRPGSPMAAEWKRMGAEANGRDGQGVLGAMGAVLDTDAIVGTPLYAAPEQIVGKDADTYSDVYSLGLVAYETLTGMRVLSSGSLRQIFQQHLALEKALPPPSRFREDVKPWLDDLIMSMLRFEATKRPASAAEVAEVLGRHLAASSVELSRSRHEAQLDLVETCYWQGMNAFHEGRFVEALLHFDQLLAFPLSDLGTYAQNLERQLLFLFWKIHGRFRDWDRPEGPAEDRRDRLLDGLLGDSDGSTPSVVEREPIGTELYLVLLERLARLLVALGHGDYAPLVASRILLLLEQQGRDEERLLAYRQLATHEKLCPRSPLILRAYADLAATMGHEAERRAALPALVESLVEAELFEEAEGLLGELKAGEIPGEKQEAIDELASTIVCRRYEALQMREAVEDLTRFFEKTERRDKAIAPWSDYVSRQAHDRQARGHLAELLLREGRQAEALVHWRRLGRDAFLSGKGDEATDWFRRVLEAEPEDWEAVCFLLEGLYGQDRAITGGNKLRDWLLPVYLGHGMAELALRKLRGSLKGDASDLAIYERIGEVSRSHGLPFDETEHRHRSAMAALDAGVIGRARALHKEAMEAAGSDELRSRMARRMEERARRLGFSGEAKLYEAQAWTYGS